MAYTFKNVKIVDPSSSWNSKKCDLIIDRGRIKQIGKELPNKGHLIEGKGLHLSPGWIDMHAHFCDPGHEYKEDLASGLAAAKNGGFTSVVTMPGTDPVIDSKGQIEYLLNRSKGTGVRVYPAATISKKMVGKDLSEMVDLSRAGARLFTDDKSAIADSSLMHRALLYARDIEGTVCSLPQEPHISAQGMMNEGVVSTGLGMKGIPHIAESIMLRRDIDLLRYSEGRMHVVGLSSADGVKLVKAAKKEGLRITAEVHLAHLLWNDSKLSAYDSNYKLSPPLRDERDRKALIKGVNDGTIDCISSDHRPEDVETKKVEFGQASEGIALIESFYPLYQTYLSNEITLERFVQALTTGPCAVLGLTPASIEEGRPAILTCFSDKEEVTNRPVHTKAYNTPCIHPEVKGKVVGTWR